MTAITTTVNVEQVHNFLRRFYKHDRFEGRNNERDGFADYSMCVARSTLEDLQAKGWSLVSQHESMTGEIVWFNDKLEIIESPFSR